MFHYVQSMSERVHFFSLQVFVVLFVFSFILVIVVVAIMNLTRFTECGIRFNVDTCAKLLKMKDEFNFVAKINARKKGKSNQKPTYIF